MTKTERQPQPRSISSVSATERWKGQVKYTVMCIPYDFCHQIFIGVPSKTVGRKILPGYLQGSPNLKENHKPKHREKVESILKCDDDTGGDWELDWELAVGLAREHPTPSPP